MKNLSKFIPKSRRGIYRTLADRYFPLNFWLRNSLRLLERRAVRVHLRTGGSLSLHLKSTSLKGKSSLWRRRYLISHLATRIRVFSEVVEAFNKIDVRANEGNHPEDYCTRCGMCCEIAGGVAEFPKNWPFPDSWKRLFTDGCGKNQWFCAFLIEDGKTGRAQCAIYPYRPVVCRKFERDECIYLHEKMEKSVKNSVFLLFGGTRCVRPFADRRQPVPPFFK